MKLYGKHDDVASAIKKEAPRKPGVYLFYDRKGRPMYVGKSVNLRNRMLSYFYRAPEALESRTRRMVHGIRGFAYRTAATELIALLLEDELIKIHQPHYNVRQKEYLECRYLLLTNDEYPTCKIVDHSADFRDARIFGPFKDRFVAGDLLDLIHRHLRLRSCRDSRPARKCMNFEIDLCRGPCRRKVSPVEYASVVERVAEFLNGDETRVVSVAESALTEAVQAREYDKAARLRDQIEFSRSFCRRQRFVRRFKTETIVVSSTDGENYEHKFVKGRLVGLRRSGPGGAVEIQIPRGEEGSTENDPRHLLDRANVVYGWVRKERRSREPHAGKAVARRMRRRRGREARA